jgi:hypothetical protein
MKIMSPDRYTKIFSGNTHILQQLSKLQLIVFINLSQFMTRNDNTVDLNVAIKKEICRDVGCTMESLANILTRLVKLKFLIKKGGGRFLINPMVSSRANKQRADVISLSFIKDLKEGKFR